MVQNVNCIYHVIGYPTIKDAHFQTNETVRHFFSLNAAQNTGAEMLASGMAWFNIEIENF